MSSLTPFQKFTLFALLVIQVWLVARVQMLQAPAACASDGGNGVPATSSDMPLSAPGSHNHAAVLARIDARLTALERAAAPQAPAAPSAASTTIDPNGPAARAADAALAAMLPGPSITDAQMAQLRTRILQAPPDQQFPLEAALARAINSGRLRVEP
jgi:hypothetical protein